MAALMALYMKKTLLKALHKNGLKISPKMCQHFRKKCNIWVIPYLLRIGEYV